MSSWLAVPRWRSPTTRDVPPVTSTFEPKEIVYEAAATQVLVADGIRVDVASPRYLLAMKLLSARASDVDDIRLLYELCGFTTAREGLDLVEAAYPGRQIPAKVQFLVEELFPGPT